MTVEYEVKISVYRNGRRITFNDALGDTPSSALYRASNDLENELERYETDRPKEFQRD
jgi:hypothetical protein